METGLTMYSVEELCVAKSGSARNAVTTVAASEDPDLVTPEVSARDDQRECRSFA